MAGRRLLKLVRAKRLLHNLVCAGCRLLDLIQAIRRLVSLQPYLGRSSSVQPCPGRRSATGRRLFNFVWASGRQLKLIRSAATCSTLFGLAGRRLLNRARVGHRLLLLTRISRCLF